MLLFVPTRKHQTPVDLLRTVSAKIFKHLSQIICACQKSRSPYCDLPWLWNTVTVLLFLWVTHLYLSCIPFLQGLELQVKEHSHYLDVYLSVSCNINLTNLIIICFCFPSSVIGGWLEVWHTLLIFVNPLCFKNGSTVCLLSHPPFHKRK